MCFLSSASEILPRQNSNKHALIRKMADFGILFEKKERDS